MRNRYKLFQAVTVLIAAASVSSGEFRVPLMKQAPKIDGKSEQNEWATSVGFEDFQWGGK